MKIFSRDHHLSLVAFNLLLIFVLLPLILYMVYLLDERQLLHTYKNYVFYMNPNIWRRKDENFDVKLGYYGLSNGYQDILTSLLDNYSRIDNHHCGTIFQFWTAFRRWLHFINSLGLGSTFFSPEISKNSSHDLQLQTKFCEKAWGLIGKYRQSGIPSSRM